MGNVGLRRIMVLAVLIMFALSLPACGAGPSDGSGTEVVGNGEQSVENGKTGESETDGSDEGALGTRQNPVPLNTEVKTGPDWHVAIININPDAWPIMQETNQFNDPPEGGHQFVMADVWVSYVGEESGTPWISLSLRYLGSDGNAYSSGCGVLPKPLSDVGEQFPGAAAEGQVCWSVPSDAVAGGAIIVEEALSIDDTRVFFKGI